MVFLSIPALLLFGVVAWKLLAPLRQFKGKVGLALLILYPVILTMAFRDGREKVTGVSTLDFQNYIHLGLVAALGCYVVVALCARQVKFSKALWQFLGPLVVYGMWSAFTVITSPNPLVSFVKAAQLCLFLGLIVALFQRGEVVHWNLIIPLVVAVVWFMIAASWISAIVDPSFGTQIFKGKYQLGRFPYHYTTIAVFSGALASVGVSNLLPGLGSRFYSRTLWMFITVVSLLTLLATQGRSGIVIALLVLIVPIVLSRRHVGWMIALILLVCSGYVAYESELAAAFIMRGQTSYDVVRLNSRIDIWVTALDHMLHSPMSIIGHGYYSGVREVMPLVFYNQGVWRGQQLHNDALNILFCTGIVGATSWAVFVFRACKDAANLWGKLGLASRCREPWVSSETSSGICTLLILGGNGLFHSVLGWDATYGFVLLVLTCMSLYRARRFMEHMRTDFLGAREDGAQAPHSILGTAELLPRR